MQTRKCLCNILPYAGNQVGNVYKSPFVATASVKKQCFFSIFEENTPSKPIHQYWVIAQQLHHLQRSDSSQTNSVKRCAYRPTLARIAAHTFQQLSSCLQLVVTCSSYFHKRSRQHGFPYEQHIPVFSIGQVRSELVAFVVTVIRITFFGCFPKLF